MQVSQRRRHSSATLGPALRPLDHFDPVPGNSGTRVGRTAGLDIDGDDPDGEQVTNGGVLATRPGKVRGRGSFPGQLPDPG
ncbi:MAG: hypothetical protein GWO24_23995 [Akkermansiaceae bacterium]|nr:hypothetical protein [Akkermansiaceae bacterium]